MDFLFVFLCVEFCVVLTFYRLIFTNFIDFLLSPYSRLLVNIFEPFYYGLFYTFYRLFMDFFIINFLIQTFYKILFTF